jgi:hypothetical protein
MGAVARHRAGEFGARAATWPRYNVENATVLLLVMAASSSGLILRETAKLRTIALAMLIVANLQLQSWNVGYPWPTTDIRSYVTAFRAYQLSGRPPLKGIVPPWVVPKWATPYNRTEYFSRLF